MNSNQAVYDKVFAGVLEALRAGVIPWRKPWTEGGLSGLPMNAATVRPYHGGNIVALWATAQLRSFTSNGWVTFRQAVDAGAVVRKGEKATPVYYFTSREKTNKETGEVETFWFARGYSVFNLDQLSDLEGRDGAVANLRRRVDAPIAAPMVDRIAACDAMVQGTGATIEHTGNRAAYAPSLDRIVMPAREQFIDGASYYGTLFHELTHWTGHESRLARPLSTKFGSPEYALEELVAELGAAMIGARFGVESIDRSAAYIASWQKALTGADASRVLARCAAQAAKAAEYLAPEDSGASTDYAEAA